MGGIRGTAFADAIIRLLRPDGSQPVSTTADRSGEFSFVSLTDGWYILSLSMPGYRETVKAVHVDGIAEADFSRGLLILQGRRATPVLSVCDALDQREALTGQPVVVVGIFKSGMDETLRLDCTTQLVTGDIGWPSAVGLTKVGNVPDELRGEVEKKRREILASAPPEAPLRPERVVGLYGRFVSLGGLSNAICCTAAVETTFPPARLFGVSETDLRVIR
jgi:hypothetical protein